MEAAALGVLALVLMAFLVVPVMAANSDNDLYTNKYAATPQTTETLGMMKGQLRAGMPGLTTGVNVTELATGAVRTLEILPDGTFEITGTPGRYLITIADGNGGQPEHAYFNIVAGQVSQIESELLGHAIPPAIGKVVDKIVIIEATYGMTKKVIDQAYVPAVPGVPAVTHQDYQAGHVHAKKVNIFSSHHDFMYNGNKYQIVGNQEETAFMVHGYTCAHLAQMTSAENPHQSFAFNNAMNPGGIVNVAQDTVLVAITDPAVGQVKNVMIKYTLNGVEKTIDTMEYETINL